MKNVTITLPEKAADWARREAAKRKMSVSRFVGEMLERHMKENRQYEAARRRFMAQHPIALKGPGEKYPTREELHDRSLR